MAGSLPGHPSGDRRAYAPLFTAHVLALLGTGVATVVLALLSYRLAGAEAGAVFGTALAIKAGTSVVLGPLASVLTMRLPRRAVLVAADLVRAAVALAMPFVSTVVQINLLIFVFQAAAAGGRRRRPLVGSVGQRSSPVRHDAETARTRPSARCCLRDGDGGGEHGRSGGGTPHRS